jgi:hypothetical protein
MPSDMSKRTASMSTGVRSGGPSHQEYAERLLKGAAKKSYDPIEDIDWDAPLEPDKFFVPPKLVSLYGTPMWQQMSRTQQIELSRQELVNALSAGIWFENVLDRALLRDLMHSNWTTATTHYTLTEIGDETRHMVMFGKAIARVGAAQVSPQLYQRIVINIGRLILRGPLLWVAALIGEEIFDGLQRRMMNDPELQPAIQQLMRIHVVEEARHIQFARDYLCRQAPEIRPLARWFIANVHGMGGFINENLAINSISYRRSGLDGRRAHIAARENPHRHEMQKSGFAPIAAFLTEVGLMGPIARRLWKRSNFL